MTYEVTVVLTEAGSIVATCSCGGWQSISVVFDAQHVPWHLTWHRDQAARKAARA